MILNTRWLQINSWHEETIANWSQKGIQPIGILDTIETSLIVKTQHPASEFTSLKKWCR